MTIGYANRILLLLSWSTAYVFCIALNPPCKSRMLRLDILEMATQLLLSSLIPHEHFHDEEEMTFRYASQQMSHRQSAG